MAALATEPPPARTRRRPRSGSSSAAPPPSSSSSGTAPRPGRRRRSPAAGVGAESRSRPRPRRGGASGAKGGSGPKASSERRRRSFLEEYSFEDASSSSSPSSGPSSGPASASASGAGEEETSTPSPSPQHARLPRLVTASVPKRAGQPAGLTLRLLPDVDSDPDAAPSADDADPNNDSKRRPSLAPAGGRGVYVAAVSLRSPFHPSNCLSAGGSVSVREGDEVLLVDGRRVRDPRRAAQIILATGGGGSRRGAEGEGAGGAGGTLTMTVSRGKRPRGCAYRLAKLEADSYGNAEASGSAVSRGAWGAGFETFEAGGATSLAKVGALSPGGPLDKAGSKEGDALLSVDGKPVRSKEEAERALAGDGDESGDLRERSDSARSSSRVATLLTYSFWNLRRRVLGERLRERRPSVDGDGDGEGEGGVDGSWQITCSYERQQQQQQQQRQPHQQEGECEEYVLLEHPPSAASFRLDFDSVGMCSCKDPKGDDHAAERCYRRKVAPAINALNRETKREVRRLANIVAASEEGGKATKEVGKDERDDSQRTESSDIEESKSDRLRRTSVSPLGARAAALRESPPVAEGWAKRSPKTRRARRSPQPYRMSAGDIAEDAADELDNLRLDDLRLRPSPAARKLENPRTNPRRNELDSFRLRQCPPVVPMQERDCKGGNMRSNVREAIGRRRNERNSPQRGAPRPVPTPTSASTSIVPVVEGAAAPPNSHANANANGRRPCARLRRRPSTVPVPQSKRRSMETALSALSESEGETSSSSSESETSTTDNSSDDSSSEDESSSKSEDESRQSRRLALDRQRKHAQDPGFNRKSSTEMVVYEPQAATKERRNEARRPDPKRRQRPQRPQMHRQSSELVLYDPDAAAKHAQTHPPPKPLKHRLKLRRGNVRDKYKVLPRVLGTGAFGTVRSCVHRKTREMLALKSIPRQGCPKNAALLKNEIALVRTIDHPHVVRTVDVVQDAEYTHIVMEECRGGDLFNEIVEKGAVLTELRVREVVEALLDAVAYLHERDIVHRDLKRHFAGGDRARACRRSPVHQQSWALLTRVAALAQYLFVLVWGRVPGGANGLSRGCPIRRLQTTPKRQILTVQEVEASTSVPRGIDPHPRFHPLLVHPDAQAEHIMLTRDDVASSPIKIIDFGLATTHNSARDPPLTAFAGSAFTVAPEVVKRSYGKECDLWSTGVIAYFLLTRRMPFNAKTDAEILQQIGEWCRGGVHRQSLIISSALLMARLWNPLARFVRPAAGNYGYPAWTEKGLSEEAKDFVDRLLVVDPKRRLTARQALSHLWIRRNSRRAEIRRSVNSEEFALVPAVERSVVVRDGPTQTAGRPVGRREGAPASGAQRRPGVREGGSGAVAVTKNGGWNRKSAGISPRRPRTRPVGRDP
ncbi:hypothetical protein ACHAWF_017664 [Thalassiosira exigua]